MDEAGAGGGIGRQPHRELREPEVAHDAVVADQLRQVVHGPSSKGRGRRPGRRSAVRTPGRSRGAGRGRRHGDRAATTRSCASAPPPPRSARRASRRGGRSARAPRRRPGCGPRPPGPRRTGPVPGGGRRGAESGHDERHARFLPLDKRRTIPGDRPGWGENGCYFPIRFPRRHGKGAPNRGWRCFPMRVYDHGGSSRGPSRRSSMTRACLALLVSSALAVSACSSSSSSPDGLPCAGTPTVSDGTRTYDTVRMARSAGCSRTSTWGRWSRRPRRRVPRTSRSTATTTTRTTATSGVASTSGRWR